MQEASHDRAGSLRETVLVVEPAEFTRHRLRASLRSDDRDVHVAGSAAEGLSLIHTLRPHLVIVGLALPDLPGTRAIDVFAQRSAGAIVVAVSQEPSVSEAVEAMRHGAADYLAATEDADRVRDAADRALNSARTQRQLQRV